VGAEQALTTDLKKREKLWAKISTETTDLIKYLKGANKALKDAVNYTMEMLKHSQSRYGFWSKLVKENKELMTASKKYCSAEKLNFTLNSERVKASLVIFKEILKYFFTHYNKIHSYIKSKYN